MFQYSSGFYYNGSGTGRGYGNIWTYHWFGVPCGEISKLNTSVGELTPVWYSRYDKTLSCNSDGSGDGRGSGFGVGHPNASPYRKHHGKLEVKPLEILIEETKYLIKCTHA